MSITNYFSLTSKIYDMNITCAECNKTKPSEEYYNCKSRKTGKQAKCKVCQKEYRKVWYNEINPTYFWGDNGYFTKRYDESINYQKEYKRADKDCKIYKLTFENGDIYIGYTKRKISVRLMEHRKHFNYFVKHGKTSIARPISLYHYIIDKSLNSQQIQNLWGSVEVLIQFEGTIKEGLKIEKETIRDYLNKGYNLVNNHK
jgi:predicted GIY-YIG superfamily endonuclease